jgi:hypothetical protein
MSDEHLAVMMRLPKDQMNERQIDWAGRLPHLYRLFAGHVIESWPSVHETVQAAVQEGIDDMRAGELLAARAELDELRAAELGDEVLDDVILYPLRGYYHREDGKYSKWLDEVAQQLDQAISAHERGA